MIDVQYPWIYFPYILLTARAGFGTSVYNLWTRTHVLLKLIINNNTVQIAPAADAVTDSFKNLPQAPVYSIQVALQQNWRHWVRVQGLSQETTKAVWTLVELDEFHHGGLSDETALS